MIALTHPAKLKTNLHELYCFLKTAGESLSGGKIKKTLNQCVVAITVTHVDELFSPFRYFTQSIC